MELERQFVIGRLAVFRIAPLVHGQLHVSGDTAGERLREKQTRPVGSPKAGAKQEEREPLHRSIVQASLRFVDWWVAWQIATARASQASSDSTGAARRRMERIIICT